MQIVIDIPEEQYNTIKSDLYNTFPAEMKEWGLEAIRSGKPLPKGHGRIGDLDALREEVSSCGMNDYEPSDFIDAIDQADTIIEADKAEREEV